jgi:hypothetical protein
MKTDHLSARGFIAVAIRTSVVLLIGVSAQIVSGQDLLSNGDFSSGLTGWKTEGTVVASDGVATLAEGAGAPVLYQAVSVSGYVYELRFDLDLSGLSSDAGSGVLDKARLMVYVGTETLSLTPDGAADEALLIEADSSGLLSVAENAQVVPNAALGAGWYSAVVEVTSDFAAIAPAATLTDGNAIADSSVGIVNVVFKSLDRGRFANISNRGGVGTGASIMIPGFVIEGPTNKSLVIRGVGPSLGELGVAGILSGPQLKLYYKPPSQPGQPAPADELKEENDNWEEAPDVAALKAAMTAVGAFDLTEGNTDAALLAEDLVPGAYTVQVSGVDGATGVALAEVYDLGASADGPTELVNISNRGFIGTGASVQIPGFVIRGTRGRVVLARAVGPTLGGFGVAGTIEDPILNLYDQAASDKPLYTNDNWEDAANTTEVEYTAARVGAFPLSAGSKDAAILASLPPGNYTAVAKGVDGATGVALVEVYVVTDNQRPTAYNNSFYVATAVANVLPMDEILGNDTDPENDALSVSFYTQPDQGTVVMNESGELVYTSPAEYYGETVFSYRASDGEYESVPATIALQVVLANTAIWIGGSSENFSDPANWIGGEAPSETNAVWIAPEGGGTVLDDADANVGSIRVGGTGTDVTLKLNGRTLTTAEGIDILPGSAFEMSS